ncbi:MAG TPA: glycosyltransferase family 39 protein [Ktedonobacteraceae bacterium]|nr:glycosyltransferase family 39 protein [Ktedonobacteraceae bacterium]
MKTSKDTNVVMNNYLSREIRAFLGRISSVVKNVRIRDRLLLLLVMGLSAFLRLYQFPSLPTGLHVNEVSAAYESYALLAHGTDLWGNTFPVYFPAGGSGQSVLLSYLNMPFIAVFGLMAFGERLSSVILSMLTIVIFYAFIKKWHGTRTALIATFLLGTSPWHIMISRWSLEANLLPCFLLLGIACLSYCYTSKYARMLIPFSLIFLALAFYTYTISLFIIPFFLLLFFGLLSLENRWQNKENPWRNTLGVMLSLLVFFLIIYPFILFILDNYILHNTPSFIEHLPLTIPLLLDNRLAQITGGQNTLGSNIQFLMGGFNDGQVWNIAGGYSPLGLLSLLLVALGIYYSIRTGQVHGNLFLIWLVATIPLFFLFPLNIVRANALFLPLIALSAIGVSGIYDSLDRKKSKSENETPASDHHDDPEEFPTHTSAIPPQVAIVSLVLVALSIYNSLFCFYYFTNYNNDIKDSANSGFDSMLMQARSVAFPNEPIYVSNWINTNYIYTLFFLKADPADFQKHSHVVVSGGTYKVLNYRNYYFDPSETEHTSSLTFLAILKDNEQIDCRYSETFYFSNDWTIERCFTR